ncbi:MAG: PEP-CTERM sorting domain-containing protein [Burkholderiales bacterium]|nr:PEP-CTERM sorting domain-containing protein [Burkholderiales bacterium]
MTRLFIRPLRAVLAGVLASTLLPATVFAMSHVQRSPGVTGHESASSTLGLAVLDAAQTTTEKGVTSLTQASADDTTGIMKVYAGIDSTGISGYPDNYIAMAFAQISASGTFVGTGTGPVTVSFYLDFDGTFETYSGNIFHQLVANLAIGRVESATTPYGTVQYGASLSFTTYLLDDADVLTEAKTTRSYVSTEFTSVEELYGGATATIVSDAQHDIAGTLRVDIDLAPGDIFSVVANVLAQVNPEPVPPFSQPFDYSQSAGAVDGLNTGAIRIVVPEGYSFSGDEGLWTSSVTAVPEPATVALMAAGLTLIVGAARWRVRHTR